MPYSAQYSSEKCLCKASPKFCEAIISLWRTALLLGWWWYRTSVVEILAMNQQTPQSRDPCQFGICYMKKAICVIWNTRLSIAITRASHQSWSWARSIHRTHSWPRTWCPHFWVAFGSFMLYTKPTHWLIPTLCTRSVLRSVHNICSCFANCIGVLHAFVCTE